jgi:23S rRNA (guanosine2251-2'-O)-methyltransferase
LEEREQIIFGRKPVLDAIKSGNDIDKVLIIQSLRGEFEIEVRRLSKENGFTIQRVPQEKLNKVSRNHTHQGIIAYLTPIKYYKLSNLLPELIESKKEPLLLIMDGVEDVRNFGAISRSALAFGVDAIVTFTKGNARINEVALKTSAGALLKIPVCREEDLSDTLAYIGKLGMKVLASSLSSDNYIESIDLTGPLAVVMGSEEKGVSLLTQDYADDTFKINQSNKMDSLNVSVAAGVILHHIYNTRQ